MVLRGGEWIAWEFGVERIWDLGAIEVAKFSHFRHNLGPVGPKRGLELDFYTLTTFVEVDHGQEQEKERDRFPRLPGNGRLQLYAVSQARWRKAAVEQILQAVAQGYLARGEA